MEIKDAESDNSYDDPDVVVTLKDVIDGFDNVNEDVSAVLDGSDDKNCTYSSSTVTARQALYSCVTCYDKMDTESKSAMAGVCLACSYRCHDGHKLIELYTKRNFRCDCGNHKFPLDNECQLKTEKRTSLNSDNLYNQNFKGFYCTCHQTYPNEDGIDEVMLQCIICEDWYHTSHLKLRNEPLSTGAIDYAGLCFEMICFQCVEDGKMWLANLTKNVAISAIASNDQAVTLKCAFKFKSTYSASEKMEATSLLLRDNWRGHLCRCKDCVDLFEAEGISFLMNLEDTIQAYEARGRQLRSGEERLSDHDRCMKALESLDRVSQIEAVDAYNNMKNNLSQYLTKFAENNKVVREEDIKEFFEGLKANKRQKVVVPDFCR